MPVERLGYQSAPAVEVSADRSIHKPVHVTFPPVLAPVANSGQFLTTTSVLSLADVRPADADTVRISVHSGTLRRDDSGIELSGTVGDKLTAGSEMWIIANVDLIDATQLVDDSSGAAVAWAAFYKSTK